MKFIKLTFLGTNEDTAIRNLYRYKNQWDECEKIFINTDCIIHMKPDGCYTRLKLKDNDMWVKETPEEIMEMINGWQDGGIVLNNRRCKFCGDLIIFSKPDEVQNLTYENKDIDLTLLSNQKQKIIKVIPETEKTITVETDSAFWELMIDGRYNIQVSKTMEK